MPVFTKKRQWDVLEPLDPQTFRNQAQTVPSYADAPATTQGQEPDLSLLGDSQPNFAPSFGQRLGAGLKSLAGNQDLALAILSNSGASPQRRSFGEILGTSMMQANQMGQKRQDDAFNQAYQRAIMAKMARPADQGRPIAVIGPDGKPQYVAENDAIGRSPLPPEHGMSALYSYVDPTTGRPIYGDASKAQGQTPYIRPERPAAGDQFDPESVDNTAQMIANNQIPMLSGYSLKSKWGQAVVSRVRELNPQFAGADYGSNAAALKQFTSGKNGNTIRSLNVAVQHLDQLGQLATALNNGDTQLINRAGNAYATQTGSAAPTNFDAAKKVVADEVVKAIVGSGGGVADREEAARSISAASSPQQLAGVIETYQGLMTGQLGGLRQQYKTATGRDNFETLLLPETRARLEKHGQSAGGPNTGGAINWADLK